MEKIEPVALAKALRKVWKTSSENSLLISQAADAIDALQAEVARLTRIVEEEQDITEEEALRWLRKNGYLKRSNPMA